MQFVDFFGWLNENNNPLIANIVRELESDGQSIAPMDINRATRVITSRLYDGGKKLLSINPVIPNFYTYTYSSGQNPNDVRTGYVALIGWGNMGPGEVDLGIWDENGKFAA